MHLHQPSAQTLTGSPIKWCRRNPTAPWAFLKRDFRDSGPRRCPYQARRTLFRQIQYKKPIGGHLSIRCPFQPWERGRNWFLLSFPYRYISCSCPEQYAPSIALWYRNFNSHGSSSPLPHLQCQKTFFHWVCVSPSLDSRPWVRDSMNSVGTAIWSVANSVPCCKCL